MTSPSFVDEWEIIHSDYPDLTNPLQLKSLFNTALTRLHYQPTIPSHLI